MTNSLSSLLIKILGIASLVVAIVVTFFVPSRWLESQVDIERDSIVTWLGTESTDRLIKDSDDIYRNFFVEPGFVERSYYLFVPTKTEDDKSGALQGFGHEYHDWILDSVRSMWLLVYQIIQRALLVKEWIWFAIFPIAAAIIDGLMIRKIKQVSYGYSSPVIYRVGIDGVILSSILLLCYLSYPAAPPASPLWPLAWYVAIAVCIHAISSNVQKMI